MGVRITVSIITAVILIVVLGAGWMYARIAAPEMELHEQLQTLIKNHDVTEMKALSTDDSTYKFLLSASQVAPITATDFQGELESNSTKMIGYFGGSVGKLPLQCYMVTTTSGFSFIPHWKLVKVSLNVVSYADPSWLNSIK